MVRFTKKLLFAAALFFIPAIVFKFFVINNTSGDIGNLGMIPFGKENDGLDVNWYKRDIGPAANVVNIDDPDSLRLFSAITIGDSFSQFTKNGYQYSLSNRLGCTVANFRCYPTHNIPENYLILLNNGFFTSNQTVILECVERSLISRFSRFDENNTFESYQDLPERDFSFSEGTPSPPFLSLFFSWIRLSVGYQNPIRRFSLTLDCFTHKRFSHTLFIYNSKKAGDGDLLWEGISVDKKNKAASNIKKMIDYSEKKGINLIILIACDKYDAYEPWIKNNHSENPTLDNLPTDRRVFNSRDCLRDAIGKGTKDVYKLNNTHWSIVGADIIGNNLYECLMANNLLPGANNHKQHPV